MRTVSDMETDLDRLYKAWYTFLSTAREICEKDPGLLSIDLWRDMERFAKTARSIVEATSALDSAKTQFKHYPAIRD